MADARHVITTGQSLSVGWDSETTTISTATEAANSKAASATDGSLSALQVPSGQRQRPDLSMGYRLAQAHPARTYAMSTHGVGGQDITALSKGGTTGAYEAAVARVTAVRTARLAAGDTYTLDAVHWIQGEQDQVDTTTRAEYVTQLAAMLADYRTDVAAITGQSSTFPLIASQFATTPRLTGASSAKISLSLLDAARTVPGVYLACPQYQMPYVSLTNVHMVGTGYYRLGELHARAHNAIIDGSGWAPFAPTGYSVAGNQIVATYHVPTGPLVFDTTTIAAQPNKGFSLSGTAAQIADVAITGPDQVTITCDREVYESTARLGYGMAYDDTLVGLGNLRDSETAVSAYDATPLPNWALHSFDNLGITSTRPPWGFRAGTALRWDGARFHKLSFSELGL